MTLSCEMSSLTGGETSLWDVVWGSIAPRDFVCWDIESPWGRGQAVRCHPKTTIKGTISTFGLPTCVYRCISILIFHLFRHTMRHHAVRHHAMRHRALPREVKTRRPVGALLCGGRQHGEMSGYVAGEDVMGERLREIHHWGRRYIEMAARGCSGALWRQAGLVVLQFLWTFFV